MHNWFTVKVKYTKQLENGTFKRVTEPYLLAAMTFTDAEARIYEELGAQIRGEFVVTGISRTEIHDIFAYDDSEIWQRVKIIYESEAGEDDKKKKVSQLFLVAAPTLKDAYDRIEENLATLGLDFQITSISVSPIIDIFPYNDSYNEEVETVEEHTPASKGKIFSASGSDVGDADLDDVETSELEDEYTDEE